MAYDGGKLRWLTMNRARELARSGEHLDHTTILRRLSIERPDFSRVRSAIEERPFLAQLDRLCAAALVVRRRWCRTARRLRFTRAG
jgi:hypothetical protein